MRRRLFSEQALLLGSDVVIEKVHYDEKDIISIDFETVSEPNIDQLLRVTILDGKTLVKHN